MRFVQIETLPGGKALVDINHFIHAVPQEGGIRLFLDELENVLARIERSDGGEGGGADFHVR